MSFSQLGQTHPLRGNEDELKSCEGKLVHWGIQTQTRSLLAYTNCFFENWRASLK